MSASFPIIALRYILCPVSGRTLRLVSGDVVNGCVRDGVVQAENGERYVIEKGILRLLSACSLSELQSQEVQERNKESLSYNARLRARHFREVVPFMRHARINSSDVVLELGCGTGRITQEMTRARLVIATDFSFASLLEAARNVPSAGNIALVEADSAAFPGLSSSFSRVISAQFLEHVPTHALRRECVRLVSRMLTPSGRVVMSVYHHDVRRRIRKEAQEGVHSNGIFFHYFTSREISSLFSEHFSMVALSYIDIMLPLTGRMRLGEEILGLLSSALAYTPLCSFAHLVVVKAEKPHTAAYDVLHSPGTI